MKKILFSWVRQWQNVKSSLVLNLPCSLTVKECFVYVIYEFNKKLDSLGIKGTILNLNLDNYKMIPSKKNGLPKDDCPSVDLKARVGKLNIEKICLSEEEHSNNFKFTRSDINKLSIDSQFYSQLFTQQDSSSKDYNKSENKRSIVTHYTKSSHLSDYSSVRSSKVSDQNLSISSKNSFCVTMLTCKF